MGSYKVTVEPRVTWIPKAACGEWEMGCIWHLCGLTRKPCALRRTRKE